MPTSNVQDLSPHKSTLYSLWMVLLNSLVCGSLSLCNSKNKSNRITKVGVNIPRAGEIDVPILGSEG